MTQLPNFKDVVAADAAAFLNLDEFGELHNVDGHDITVVIDEDTAHERSRQPLDLYNAANGVFISNITLYVRLSDLGYHPVVGQHLRIDGKMYPIVSCGEDMGLLRIGLEVNDA